jgi:hypothetical protein
MILPLSRGGLAHPYVHPAGIRTLDVVPPSDAKTCMPPSVRESFGPGTDVTIFKIFSPKNSAKKLAFFDSKQSQILKK